MIDLKLNPYKDLEEISLRDELADLISGEDFGEEKRVPFVHRKLRRDKTNNFIFCTCYNKSSGEGRIGCPYCEGVGKMWDEKIISGFLYFLTKRLVISGMTYTIEAGRREQHEAAFITEYFNNIENEDIIISPALNEEGFFITPFRVEDKFMVINSRPYRLDGSRKELTASVLKKINDA